MINDMRPHHNLEITKPNIKLQSETNAGWVLLDPYIKPTDNIHANSISGLFHEIFSVGNLK